MKKSKQTNSLKSLKIDGELHNLLKQYCSMPNTPKIKEVVESLIEDFIAEKTLSNDCIVLKNPFYLNTTFLLQNNTYNCVKSFELVGDLNNCMVIKKIPNNLDTWSDVYQTYCFEDRNTHRGVLPYLALLNKNDEDKILFLYHFFYYDEVSDELKISIVNKKNLMNTLSFSNNKELLNSFINLEKEFNADIERGELSFTELILKYNDDSIMNNFAFENANRLISQIGESLSEQIDLSSFLENISKMNSQLSEIGKVDFKEMINVDEKLSSSISPDEFLENVNDIFNIVINTIDNETELSKVNDLFANLNNPELYEKFSFLFNCDDEKVVDVSSDFIEVFSKSLWDYYKNHTEVSIDNVHRTISNLENLPLFKEIEDMIYTCDTEEEFLEKVRCKVDELFPYDYD